MICGFIALKNNQRDLIMRKKYARITQLLIDDLTEFFPYLLVFYLICLILSFFSKSWKAFFYWPAFLGVVILFGVLCFFSTQAKEYFKNKPQINQKVNIIKQYLSFLGNLIISVIKKRLKAVILKDGIKIGIIGVVLIFSLLQGIGTINFLILGFALLSLFFSIDSRIAAAAALILLALCPLFAVLKQEIRLENTAVYAYYFLLITVISQIKELLRETKTESSKDKEIKSEL